MNRKTRKRNQLDREYDTEIAIELGQMRPASRRFITGWIRAIARGQRVWIENVTAPIGCYWIASIYGIARVGMG